MTSSPSGFLLRIFTFPASAALAVFAAFVPTAALAQKSAAPQRSFQKLWIPPLLSGRTVDLTLAASTVSLWPGATTKSFGYNGEKFWGPTVILNRGDAVQLRVHNKLDEVTTVHWHGLHLPPEMDGGPHQPIKPGTSWTSSFTVSNNASTYWYHPHPHEATQRQLTMGAGGLIIVRDPAEAKLDLPRTYGVDDIPLVLTSRRFTTDDQFSSVGDSDKYGDFMLVNGTLDAQAALPAQFVRLRLLNAEIERGYELGFSDNRTFHVIATDGGLVDKPIPVTRLKLMVGERVEILLNLSQDKPGSSLDLMSFNAGQPFGFPGGEPGRTPPNGSFLNNLNFRVLHLNVTASTAKPVTKLPAVLAQNSFPSERDVSQRRTVTIDRIGPPEREFAFDKKYFDMHLVNHVVKLGATESWTVKNDRIFGHSFHIHDVQFRIVSRSDGPVPASEQGWKDTCYVPRGASVTFVARFDDFANDSVPFMYHCHMSNHEDGGLMGQFLVSKNPDALKRDATGNIRLASRVEHPLTPAMLADAAARATTKARAFVTTDLDGQPLSLASLTATKPLLLYFIESECPCSREAAAFLGRLQAAHGDTCTVLGVINTDSAAARLWSDEVKPSFPVVADPKHELISAFGARCSLYTTLVAPGGTIVKTNPGYNAQTLRELSGDIARLNRREAPSLSTEGAPETLLVGCPLE